MSALSLVDVVRDLKFFRDIEESRVERLADIARHVEFPARKEMFHQHDKARDVYVIITGQVSLEICEPKVGCRQLMQLGAGDLVGWSPLAGRLTLSDTARTLTEVKAIAISGPELLNLCYEDPVFGFEFMHRVAMVLAERLDATRIQLMKQAGYQLPSVQPESD